MFQLIVMIPAVHYRVNVSALLTLLAAPAFVKPCPLLEKVQKAN